MKKIVSMLLALSLMVSMLTICTFAADTDKTNPYIVSAVAISDTQLQVTISEPIYVYKAGVWALFFEKDGVVDTATRTGGTVQVEEGTLCDTFTWKIDSGSISNTIVSKAQAGYKAYFGINTNNTYIEIAPDRATDEAGNMFLKNVESNGYSIHAISVDPYYNMIRSVTLIQEYKLEIEFLHPITEFVDGTTGVLLIGVLNKDRNGWYNTSTEPITTTKRLTPTVTERGTLLCTLSADLDGMDAGDKRNIAKYMEKVNTTYAAQGYVAGIQILEPGDGNKNDNLLERVLTADGTPLYGPQSTSGRAFCHAAIDSVYESAQLVSASLVSDTSIKVKFNKEVTIVSSNGGFGIVALDSNGNVLFDGSGNNNDKRKGGTVDKTSGTEFVWTIDAGNNAVATIAAWEAAGYTVKFCSNSGGNPNPAGYNPRVVDANGYPLPAPVAKQHAGTTYLYYALCDITIENDPFELVSVTQIAPYQVALKFSEELRTDERNGLPWTEDVINNSTDVAIGITWVKDDCTGQEAFDSVTTDAIKGTVALGETNDTLIWTVNNEVPANFISNLLKDTKDGYTRKFYLYDNGCGWHGAGFIGGIQAQKPSATEEKALSIPESNKTSSGTHEYLFMDITPDPTPTLELVSVAEIGDYQLELQFTQELSANIETLINTNKNALLGIAQIKDGHTGQEAFADVVVDQVGGTVTRGATSDTLIWTAGDQTKTISERLSNKQDGYTWKFYLYDSNCEYHGTGFIGGVQGVHPSTGAALALSIPEAYKKTENNGAYEYMFMDIHSYLEVEQSEAIELQEKPYHFMNADTGRSLVVDGAEEFTVVRKAADSNMVMLMVGEQYVDLHSTPATLSDTPYHYLLEACENDRYRLMVTPIYALSDGDTGEDNVASLAYENATLNSIATGWYLTASGDAKPLRILPIGDSITYGTNPDGFVHGWRNELSADLAEKLDRVVFVGSQASKISSIDEAALYRHEGNPGWTATHIADNRQNLAGIADGVVDKYDPDVVLLMVGINDMHEYIDVKQYDNETALAALKAGYKTLVEKLKANMEENDVIFCSTLTPTNYTNTDRPALVNSVFPTWVKEWAAEGLPVALNDNYTDLKDEDGVQCSDKLHLSSVGDALVAQQYAKSILNYYNTDGTAMDLQERIKAAVADGLTEIYLNGDTTAENLVVDAGITLDLNGHTLTAANLNSYGNIIDSSKGDAVLKITDGELFYIYKDNPAMALYDAQAGGYRFFDYEVNSLMKEPDNNTKKFGVQIDFEQAKAYELLAAEGNANTSVSLDIMINGQTYTHTFSAGILAEYAEQAGAKLGAASTTKTTLVLTVTGYANIPEGTTVTVSGAYVSTTGVASSFSY